MFHCLFAAALLTGLGLSQAVPLPNRDAVPVIVELFTSEGCSSCPPADTLVAKLAADQPIQGTYVLALGEHVDYWDHLGWRDQFSSSAYTARQSEYGRVLRKDVYTPQVVVDGQDGFVGTDLDAFQRALEKAARAPKGRVELAVGGSARPVVTVRLSGLQQAQLRQTADLVVAITEDGLGSEVRSGENRGKKLSHAAVVRSLVVASKIARDADTFAAEITPTVNPAWQRDRLRVVAFVQERSSRRIVAANAIPLAVAPASQLKVIQRRD
jgi:hypothetical protein